MYSFYSQQGARIICVVQKKETPDAEEGLVIEARTQTTAKTLQFLL